MQFEFEEDGEPGLQLSSGEVSKIVGIMKDNGNDPAYALSAFIFALQRMKKDNDPAAKMFEEMAEELAAVRKNWMMKRYPALMEMYRERQRAEPETAH